VGNFLPSFLGRAWDNQFQNIGEVDYDNSTNEFLERYTEENMYSPENIPIGKGDTGDGMFKFLRDYKMLGE
jgi:hypothetical protein